MKKVIFIVLAFVCINTYSYGQSYAALQLKKYCIIDPSAQFVIDHSHGNELKVSIEEIGWKFQTVHSTQPGRVSNLAVTTLREYKTANDVLQDYNNFLDPGWVACLGDDFWSLISKQLDGQSGALSTNSINYTVCTVPNKNDGLNFRMITISWSPEYKKWLLSSTAGISGMPIGSRFIRLK